MEAKLYIWDDSRKSFSETDKRCRNRLNNYKIKCIHAYGSAVAAVYDNIIFNEWKCSYSSTTL